MVYQPFCLGFVASFTTISDSQLVYLFGSTHLAIVEMVDIYTHLPIKMSCMQTISWNKQQLTHQLSDNLAAGKVRMWLSEKVSIILDITHSTYFFSSSAFWQNYYNYIILANVWNVLGRLIPADKQNLSYNSWNIK